MIGHTGFLIFARPVIKTLPKPMGTSTSFSEGAAEEQETLGLIPDPSGELPDSSEENPFEDPGEEIEVSTIGSVSRLSRKRLRTLAVTPQIIRCIQLEE